MHCSDYEAWGASGNYEARKAVEENRKAFEESGKPLKKVESHRRKQKTIEESGEPLKKAESRLGKIGFHVRKIGF